MRDEMHRSGAVFRTSEPLTTPWNLNMQDDTGRAIAHIGGVVGLPHLVVRLRDSAHGYRDARHRCLLVAQRALDVLSVSSSQHLELDSVRGEESHFVWWESSELGHVLRYTSFQYLDPEVILAPLQRMSERVRASISPERLAPSALPPPWHPSFRYFRAAQCADDLANAFRNMYLALESLLDSVHPKAGSGLSEREWIIDAVKTVVPTANIARVFDRRSPTGSAVDHVLAIYNDKRLTTFHSKTGGKTRLPFVEDDVGHGELEQAFIDISDLYLDLARTYLHVDRRVGQVLMKGGWQLATSFMVGASSIYVTTDDAPDHVRIDDETLNPRSAVMFEMRTRNAQHLEGPFDRVFKGTSSPADAQHPATINGWTLGVADTPILGGTFDAPLLLHGIDQLQIVAGCSYRRPDMRVGFRS